ncbi:MAG TPA: DUF2207 domain-containing protein [Candidatus Acidoferrales bacterium]|nr:DUF2207 domain-containing protein [Candidatus Acidoferrales bacterium]
MMRMRPTVPCPAACRERRRKECRTGSLSFPGRAAAVLVVFISLAFASGASARDLRIEKFDAEIVVSPKGTIDVTETIQVRFIGSWNGIYRSIPVEYVSPQGFNYTLFLDVKRVTDEAGNSLKFESSRERHYRKLKISVPGANNAVRTVVIEYGISDALRFFEDHDELYWNVTGDEWDFPLQSASARIILPEGTTGIRTNRFTGGYRSRAQDADVEIAGSGVEVKTRSPLGYHEGLTIAVAFDKGFVHEPTTADRISLFLRSNWPLAFPVIAFALMFFLWWTQGRDPRLRPIAAQYEPPAQLTPGEVGTLVEDNVNMRDITATLVDLAVRGYLVIEEQKKEHLGGLWSDKDYQFILQRNRSAWTELKSHERELLRGIFSSATAGETVSMSSLENQFYTHVAPIKDFLFGSLVTHGYYRDRPDSTRQTYFGAGVVIGILLAWGGNLIGRSLGMAPLTFIVSGVLTGMVICAFGWFMPARTAEGTRALEGALGFEDFLQHVESDRFARTVKTPEMFEKFLPFAMALGVDKNWSRAFQDICKQPPDWYRGSYGPQFFPVMFVSDLSTMSSRASSVLSSAPRSSGGSGFGGGGGGFSGGGFGGGGGGGW